MKKTLIVTLLLILTTAVSVFALGGKSGDKDAIGGINDLNVTAGGSALVQGITQNGSLWLAYTVRWKDGVEKDYEPIKVDGKFSKNIYFQLRPQGVSEVIVCLWRYKVSASRCAKDNGGTACQYCQKNGFHMEDRRDCKVGN